jgi:hypothetical protein
MPTRTRLEADDAMDSTSDNCKNKQKKTDQQRTQNEVQVPHHCSLHPAVSCLLLLHPGLFNFCPCFASLLLLVLSSCSACLLDSLPHAFHPTDWLEALFAGARPPIAAGYNACGERRSQPAAEKGQRGRCFILRRRGEAGKE